MKRLLAVLLVSGSVLGIGSYWLSGIAEYPEDSFILSIKKGDIDGDGEDETVTLSADEDGDLQFRIIKWKDAGPVVMDESEEIEFFEVQGWTMEDMDGDGKCEVIVSMCEEVDDAEGDYIKGWVWVGEWDGEEIEDVYESPDLLKVKGKKYPAGLLLGLCVADTDGDGKREIAVGVTRPNQDNMEQTEENFDQDNYTVVGPLAEASIVRIEYDGTYTILPEEPIGSGLVYRLTSGQMDASAGSEIVADIFELNYKNLNTFIGRIKEFEENVDALYPEKALSILEKSISRRLALKRAFCDLGPIALPKLYKKAKGVLEKSGEKAGARLLSAIAGIGATHYEEIKEKLLPDIPEIPDPLFATHIKVLSFGRGLSVKSSTNIGFLNFATRIAENRAIAKPLDFDYTNINSYIATLNTKETFLYIKRYERSDWRGWEGDWEWEDTDYYSEPQNLPQVPGRLLEARLICLDKDAELLWQTAPFGPFNPELVIDGNRAVVGIVDIDIDKANKIIAHIESEIKRHRENKYIAQFRPPEIPDGLIYGKVAAYSIADGKKVYETPELGIIVAGIDRTESVACAVTDFSWSRLNNFIADLNEYTKDYEKRIKEWREVYAPSYFEQRAKVIAHENVARLMEYYWNTGSDPYGWEITGPPSFGIEDIDGDGEIDTYNYTQVFNKEGFEIKITEVSEDINGNGILDSYREWPRWSRPDWDFEGELEGEGITWANLTTIEDGIVLWKSERIGDLSMNVRTSDRGICCVGYEFSSIIPSIYLFSSQATDKCIVYGKVENYYGDPIEDALVLLNGATGTTGASGAYQIGGLEPGNYEAVAQKIGYCPQTKTITLSAGEIKRLDFTLIRERLTIRGYVMDIEKNPIENANVSAISPTGKIGTLTDKKGYYEIENLAPGLYKVSAHKEGYSSISYDIELYTDEWIDFVLGKAGRIAGVVYDEDGNPVEGAEVVCWGEFGGGECVSGLDGYYSIDNLPSGIYSLEASSTTGYSFIEGVFVEEGETTYIDIHLSAVGGIEGIVDIANLPTNRYYGVVAFREMVVTMENVWDVITEEPVAFSDVGEDGSFLLYNLPAGIYDIYLFESTEQDGKRPTKRSMILRAQQEEEPFYITQLSVKYDVCVNKNEITDCGTLTPTFGEHSISGEVRTADGGPLIPWETEDIEDWPIVVLINEDAEIASFGPIVLTDPDRGNYKLGDIVEGVYTFLVLVPEYIPHFEMVKIDGDITKDVVVTKVGARIKGIVSDGVYPIKSAKVRIVGNGMDRSVLTDEDGDYQFSNLLPGAYSVSAEAVGHSRETKDVWAKEGGLVIANFELKREEELCSVYGVVESEAGALSGAKVLVVPENLSCITGKSGSYTAKGLSEGPHLIIAKAVGYFPEIKDVELFAGEKKRVDFYLKKGELRFRFSVYPTEDGVKIEVRTSEPLTGDLFYSFVKENEVIKAGTETLSGDRYILELLDSEIKVLAVEEITLEVSGTGSVAGYSEDTFLFGMKTEITETAFAGIEGAEAEVEGGAVEIRPGSIEGTETVELVIGKRKGEEELVSDIYKVEIGAELAEDGEVILTLSYDPAKVGNPCALAVYRKVGDSWVKVGKVIEINLLAHTVKVLLTKDDFGGIKTAQTGESGEFAILEESAKITVSPSSGYCGTVITVKGTGFDVGENVRIDFGTTTSIAEVTATDGSFTTTFTADQQTPGTIEVVAKGETNTASAHFYYYTPPPPRIVNIFPRSGTNTGTVSLTISGENFFGTPTAKIGSIRANKVNLTGTTTITCEFDLRDSACGLYDLIVKNPDGQSDTEKGAFYIYAQLPSLTITGSSSAQIGTSGGTIVLDGVVLSIPENAIISTQTVRVSYIAEADLPSDLNWMGKVILLEPHGLFLKEEGSLTVPITQSDLKEIGADSVNEVRVYICYGEGAFSVVPEEDLERELGRITITLNHFSYYGFGATGFAKDNNNVIVYPNPAKQREEIYFDNVSEGAVIEIYTVAGELVERIDVTQCPQPWDIKDIASGVYLYTVTGGGGGKSVGKIGIVR